MWSVEFYEKVNGEAPVREFLNSLDVKMRTKAIREIDLLKMSGTTIREPHSKHI